MSKWERARDRARDAVHRAETALVVAEEHFVACRAAKFHVYSRAKECVRQCRVKLHAARVALSKYQQPCPRCDIGILIEQCFNYYSFFGCNQPHCEYIHSDQEVLPIVGRYGARTGG